MLGAGGGILEATTLITALADKYKQTQTHVIYRLLVQQGLAIAPTVVLVRWRKKAGEMGIMRSLGTITAYFDLAEQNKIIAYNYPQGVLTQTLRRRSPPARIISDIGIGTFVDPRQQGGKLNEVTKEDLIKLVEFDNKEYLYYKAIAPDIAFICATTCDSEGYATLKMR